jgi:hypothetical protein
MLVVLVAVLRIANAHACVIDFDCGFGNFCKIDDGTCHSKQCNSQVDCSSECDDGNPCTQDYCDYEDTTLECHHFNLRGLGCSPLMPSLCAYPCSSGVDLCNLCSSCDAITTTTTLPPSCPAGSFSPQLQRRQGSDAFALAAASSAGALTVIKASFKVDAGSFLLQGSVHGFSLDGAEALALIIGNLAQSVPIGQVRSHGTRTKFKARKGAHGLTSLVIDRGKGTFTAQGGGVSLVNLPNPARVALTAAGFDGCTLIKLRAKRRRSGALASLVFNGADAQFACIIPDEPIADPPAFLTAEPTPVTVRAQVAPDPDLDASSVKLWRVDDALNPIGSALGTLLDSGDVATDGSRIYTTTQSFTEPNPTQVHLQISANVNRGGSTQTAWSPSFALDVETPLTSEQFQAAVDTHDAAYQVFATVAAKIGYSLRAATRATKAIKDLPGVHDASVADNGDISITYDSGIKGVLEVHPHPEFTGVPASAVAGRASDEAASLVAIRPADTGGNAALCNNKVLIWNSAEDDPRLNRANEHVQNIHGLFKNSTTPKFDVTYLGGSDATAASVDTFADYGTLFIFAHENIYHPLDYPVFLTADRPDPQELTAEQKKKFDVDGLALVVRTVGKPGTAGAQRQLRIGVTWKKLATLKFQKNAIVAMMACKSASDKASKQIDTFLQNGAGVYFGWSDDANLNSGAAVYEALFRGLVVDHKNTAEAFAAIPDKSAPTPHADGSTAHAELQLRPQGGTPVVYQLAP